MLPRETRQTCHLDTIINWTQVSYKYDMVWKLWNISLLGGYSLSIHLLTFTWTLVPGLYEVPRYLILKVCECGTYKTWLVHIYLNGQFMVDHYLTFLFHWRVFLYVVYLINKFYIEINMFFISQGFNSPTTFLSYNYFMKFLLIWWNLWCHKSTSIFNSTTTYTSVACAIGPSTNSFPNSP
jgi:hypothetical protein